MAGGQWLLLALVLVACVALGAVAMWVVDTIRYNRDADTRHDA